MSSPKYRLRADHKNTRKAIVIGDRSFLIDVNFHANHKNADKLIESNKLLASWYETRNGEPVKVRDSADKSSKKPEAKAETSEAEKQEEKPEAKAAQTATKKKSSKAKKG